MFDWMVACAGTPQMPGSPVRIHVIMSSLVLALDELAQDAFVTDCSPRIALVRLCGNVQRSL
jgi:hypothetical protein